MATYLVVQATGIQSSWVIKHLLKTDGIKIHAVVRDLDKVPSTSILKGPRVTLFQGESKNVDDILGAARGCKGAFLNTFPIPGLEVQQARSMVDACLSAGVEVVVVSTTIRASDRMLWESSVLADTGLVAYYDAKAAVEDAVRSAGFAAYTVLRPAFLHNDYLLPHSRINFPELPDQGELAHCYNDGVAIPHVDAGDVGRFAAAALRDPAKFSGQEINLFSEILTVEQARDVLVRVSGREVRVRKRSPEEQQKTAKTVVGQKFQLLANVRDLGDMRAVPRRIEEKYGIRLTPLEESMQREKARVLETIPA